VDRILKAPADQGILDSQVQGSAVMSILVSLLLLQAAAVPPAAEPAKPSPLDKIVCKTVAGSESRLDTKRVCMTRRDWNAMAANGEEVTKEKQNIPRVNRPY
jgi:hypothetical protein